MIEFGYGRRTLTSRLGPASLTSQSISQGGYDTLQKSLEAHAKKDKCRIRFAQSHGPDCTPNDHFHEMTIISNIAREATYDQHGVIQDFCQHGFGPWIVDDEQQRAQHHQAAAQTYSGNPDLKAPPRTLLAQLGNLSFPNSGSICWQKRITPPKSLRFLRSTSEQHTPFRGISSSSIHWLLHMLEDQETELRSALELLALSPQLLWDMLKSTSAQRKKAQERHKTIGIYHCAIGQAFKANKSEHVSVLVQALKTTNTTAERGQKREIADDSELPNLRKRQRIC